MSNKVFEETVLDRLSSIESRLASIEESLSGIGDFASDIISDESSPLNADMLESIRSTLTALSAPMESVGQQSGSATGAVPINDILDSLSEFKDRIAGIRQVMSEENKR